MYIASRSKLFAHLDRLAAWRAGETPAPVTVEWNLSNRCSLGCQACHFAHTHSRGPWAQRPRLLPMAFDSTGDLADMAVVERGLSEMAVAGVKAVVWSGGGEPTLHPHWQDAVRMAQAAGLEQGMYTLGGHLTPESAALMAHAATFVVVSLDAYEPDTYAKEKGVAASRFTAAISGITSLVGHRAAVGVSYLLHAGNWRFIPEMVSLARDLGATYSTFRPAINFDANAPAMPNDDRRWISDAMNLLQIIQQEPDVEIDPARFADYRDWRGHGYTDCIGIRMTTTVTPDGRVWICPNRCGMPKSCLGDLSQTSFAALWAQHIRTFAVDEGCRVMCRLHPINETLAAIEAPHAHEAFL